MKHVKRILAFALTLVMAFGFVVTAQAEETTSANGPASITIKVPTNPAPTGDTTYNIYKVFGATRDADNNAIAYTLVSGKTINGLATYFRVDEADKVVPVKDADGKVVAEDENTDKLNGEAITAIANYVKGDDPVATVVWQPGDGESITVSGLEYGYYYITTATGTAVTIDSTNPDAIVQDKNSITTVVKSAGTAYDENAQKAIAAVGTDQPFTAQIKLGKGAVRVKFKDVMTKMTYNQDVAISVDGVTVDSANYVVNYPVAGEAEDFVVEFKDDYIATLSENTVIQLNYTGKVTSDALSVDPATNQASVTSGHDDQNTQETVVVEVYNAKFTVHKQDGDKEPLAGAGFVIKNAENKYYKIDNNVISWVGDINDATEYTSDSTGAVQAFMGLGAGNYTLVEKTVPTDYNKADDIEFTIVGNDYSTRNLEQEANVTNNTGVELPSTGGIGTTIFYIVGGVMVAGAVIFLLTKRRVNAE